jgi:CubicO group peptidase (beta-lactamase class C family)
MKKSLRWIPVWAALCAPLAWAEVPHNAHLIFDGQNDVATIANSATLSPTAQITVEAWVFPGSIPATKNQARVVSKTGSYEITLSTGDTGCGFGTTGTVQWRATIAGSDARVCGGTLITSDWQHVAGTYDGTRFKLYVNGELVANVARTGAIAVNTNPVRFGNTAALDRPLSGGLNEVRIWRRALTQAQLQAGIETTLTGNEADLVAYHRIDETGQTLLDSSPNGNNGVLGTSANADPSDPRRSNVQANAAPTVNAGPDQTIQLPNNTVQLSATVQDDGNPFGSITLQWEKWDGPGTVTFSNPNSFQTSATFSTAGTYVLQLVASDGALTGGDMVQVQVLNPQSVTSLEVKPRFITLGRQETQQFYAKVTPQVPVSWSATGGTISNTGVYTAPTTAGTYTIRATAGGVTKVATVDVTSTTTVWPTTTWPTATPDAMGLDANLLAQARDYALTYGGSGMITRGGRVVMSWGSATTRYDVKSTTKSLGSILVGIAVQDGIVQLNDAAQLHMSSIGVPPTSNTSTGWLDDITLLHLGTHTAGFGKAGGYTALTFEPGTAFSYSDGGPNWLADVLTTVYATDLRTIAFSRVFTRMGLTSTDLTWRLNGYREQTLNGVTRREFGAGIVLDVDAMTRAGYLFLRRGTWSGERLLPDDFVQRVQQPQPEVLGVPVRDGRVNASNHYGYLWWNNADSTLASVPRDAYWAHGLGESYILVIPSLDMVIARAGNGWAPSGTPQYGVHAAFFDPIVAAVRAKISVPQLAGQTQAAAVTAIEAAGLAVSGITQQSSGTVPAGRVISQSPGSGAQVARNTGVRLVISSGAP